jgi:hypothetical protein
VAALDNFLLVIFEKYAELLKKRFSDDFHEVSWNPGRYAKYADSVQIVSTDDYMPMPVGNLDEYDKVINVSWYVPDKPRESLTYVSLQAVINIFC